jgi:hypothetical protein
MDGPSVGLHDGSNFISGFSPLRQISDVRFERLNINGQRARRPSRRLSRNWRFAKTGSGQTGKIE